MDNTAVDIILCEPIATIAPEIYGHFMEHLGECVYNGCWVGSDSSIPNVDGFRIDVVEAMRKIKPAVIRWPGGCFADDYHWRDGIGPQNDRPKSVNIHWGNVIESNEVGTHEFIRFCQLVGAEPYFAGNLGSGTVREMRDWVEYCNYPGESSLSLERAKNGAPEPFGIRYWGVGNENWGCGGNFSPEDYGTEYRRYTSYLRNFGGTKLSLIACGPNGNDLDWTRRFFTKMRKDYWSGTDIHGYSAHVYCGTAGTSTDYSEAQWYRLLYESSRMEQLVVQQRALMDAFDPQRKVGLIVDEWGTWHPAEPGRNPAFLWQQNTIRDAQVAAITLNIFNRHADKVVMANIAQAINVLQSMILTNADQMVTTPTYHVYDLFSDHQGGQSIRTLVSTPALETENGKLDQVSVSSSLKSSTLTITLVNSDCSNGVDITLRLHGRMLESVSGAQGIQFPARDIHACNTFDNPDEVTVADLSLVVHQGPSEVQLQLTPAAIVKLTLALSD